MAIETLHCWSTFHSRNRHPYAVTLSRSPVRHITLKTHHTLISHIRRYLELSKENVTHELTISYSQLDLIESEVLPPTDSLIELYSRKLGVRPKHLVSLLNHRPKYAPEKFMKSALTAYLSLVLGLKNNDS